MAGASPDEASSGICFSGLLSRILCSRSFTTHPSDPLQDTDSESFSGDRESSVKSVQANAKTTGSTSPGAVARLMGLESMPDFSAQRRRSFGSFLRSRSVNFIDFLPQIDLTGEAQHRRVRTSVGSDQEKHGFVVLCFDSRDGTGPHPASFQELKAKKVEKPNQKSVVKKSTERLMVQEKRSLEGSVPAKKRHDNVNINRKGNLALKDKSAVKKPGESMRDSKPKRNTKNRNDGSILEHPKSSPTKPEKSGKLRNCSKMELSKPRNAIQLKEFKHDKASKAAEGKVCRARKKEVCGSSGVNMIEEICRLADECAAECWWICGGVFKLEESEEICMHFSDQILDVLMDDVVVELVLMHKSTI